MLIEGCFTHIQRWTVGLAMIGKFQIACRWIISCVFQSDFCIKLFKLTCIFLALLLSTSTLENWCLLLCGHRLTSGFALLQVMRIINLLYLKFSKAILTSLFLFFVINFLFMFSRRWASRHLSRVLAFLPSLTSIVWYLVTFFLFPIFFHSLEMSFPFYVFHIHSLVL